MKERNEYMRDKIFYKLHCNGSLCLFCFWQYNDITPRKIGHQVGQKRNLQCKKCQRHCKINSNCFFPLFFFFLDIQLCLPSYEGNIVAFMCIKIQSSSQMKNTCQKKKKFELFTREGNFHANRFFVSFVNFFFITGL